MSRYFSEPFLKTKGGFEANWSDSKFFQLRVKQWENYWLVSFWKLELKWNAKSFNNRGFYLYDNDSLNFQFGINENESQYSSNRVRSWSCYLPWMLNHCRQWNLVQPTWHSENNSMPHPNGYWIFVPNKAATADIGSKWEFDFKYTDPRTGEVDNVKATVRGEMRKWRRHWLPFTALFGVTRRQIWVKLSSSIGPNKDSWKGGLCGFGEDMLPGETIEQTLRRAEKNLVVRRKN